jgi:hypothetical protein
MSPRLWSAVERSVEAINRARVANGLKLLGPASALLRPKQLKTHELSGHTGAAVVAADLP